MFCGLPVEWEKMENSNFYARIRALIYRRIRRHKNPPPKAAMEAREFIHVRLHLVHFCTNDTMKRSIDTFQNHCLKEEIIWKKNLSSLLWLLAWAAVTAV